MSQEVKEELSVHPGKDDSCPACGYKVDTHAAPTDAESRGPIENDISICLSCGAWNKFDKDLNIIPFTEEDKNNASPELIVEMEKITGRIKSIREKEN